MNRNKNRECALKCHIQVNAEYLRIEKWLRYSIKVKYGVFSG